MQAGCLTWQCKVHPCRFLCCRPSSAVKFPHPLIHIQAPSMPNHRPPRNEHRLKHGWSLQASSRTGAQGQCIAPTQAPASPGRWTMWWVPPWGSSTPMGPSLPASTGVNATPRLCLLVSKNTMITIPVLWLVCGRLCCLPKAVSVEGLLNQWTITNSSVLIWDRKWTWLSSCMHGLMGTDKAGQDIRVATSLQNLPDSQELVLLLSL